MMYAPQRPPVPVPNSLFLVAQGNILCYSYQKSGKEWYSLDISYSDYQTLICTAADIYYNYLTSEFSHGQFSAGPKKT